MKNIIIFISAFMLCNTQAFAEDKGFTDVFEEMAAADGEEIKTYPIDIEGEKNQPVKSSFNFSGDNICTVEISFYPKHGTIEADGANMTFVYTPRKNFIGKDTFYYKVSNGKYTSNVSKCSIKIKNTSAENKLSVFGYSDMMGSKSEYAAQKLAEADILKGDKIGINYYFYPQSAVTRSAAAGCIAHISRTARQDAALPAGAFSAAGIFSGNYDDEVYYACKSGIIYGEQYAGEADLRLDDIVTRAEFLCMLDRAMGLKSEIREAPAFEDSAQIPDYAVKSIERLCTAEIITDKDNYLRPNEPLTKEDMAELLYKYMCYEKNSVEKTINQRIIEKLNPEVSV